MYKQDTIKNFAGSRGLTSTQRKLQQKKTNLGLKKSGSDPASTNDNSDLKIAGASKLDSIVQQIESLQKTVEEQQRTLTEREKANSELKELVTAQADKINELEESNTQLSTKLAQSEEEQKAATEKLKDDFTTATQNSKEELSSQIAQMKQVLEQQKQDYSQKTEQNSGLVNENSQKLENFTSMFQQLIVIALNNGLEIKEILDSVANFQTFVVEVFELDEVETERQFPDNSRGDKEEFLAKCQEYLPNIDTGIIEGFQQVIEGQYTEIEESLTGENTENTEVTEL